MWIKFLRERKNWVISFGLFVLFLSEIYLFEIIGREKITNSAMSLALANKLWLKNNLFSFKISFLLIFFTGLILYFLLQNKVKIKTSKSLPWIFGHLGFLTVYVIFLGSIANSGLSYWPLLLLFYFITIAMAFTLVMGTFGWNAVRQFFVETKEKVFISLTISYVFLNFYTFFQKSWPFFSKIVAYPVYKILSLFYSDAFITTNTELFGRNFVSIPTVGNGTFAGIIFRPCSGIEGLSLFLLLFTIIVIIEWKSLNLWKVALLYPIGFISMILFNILRIAALIMAGIEISPSVALGGFHSNFGWVVFSLFFFVFLRITYGWMKK